MAERSPRSAYSSKECSDGSRHTDNDDHENKNSGGSSIIVRLAFANVLAGHQ